jgi:hypothetical protein
MPEPLSLTAKTRAELDQLKRGLGAEQATPDPVIAAIQQMELRIMTRLDDLEAAVQRQSHKD